MTTERKEKKQQGDPTLHKWRSVTSDGRRKRQTQLCEIKMMKTFVVKVNNKDGDERLKKIPYV